MTDYVWAHIPCQDGIRVSIGTIPEVALGLRAIAVGAAFGLRHLLLPPNS